MNSMFLPDCTEEEISKIISELQNEKSRDIPISVNKKCSPVLSPILAKHFNHLMQIGEFPDPLKFKDLYHTLFESYLTYGISGLFLEHANFKSKYKSSVIHGFLIKFLTVFFHTGIPFVYKIPYRHARAWLLVSARAKVPCTY